MSDSPGTPSQHAQRAIAGSLQTADGQISFEGDLAIEGGIGDNVIVSCTGDLRVGELVQCADIRAGRDAHLSGGMAGRESGVLAAARDLTTTYLDALNADVGRDATVLREIGNTKLIVGRDLLASDARACGGEIRVGRAMRIAQLGSDAEARTDVILGRVAELDQLVEELARALPVVDQQLSKSLHKLDQLKRNASKPTAAQAEQLTELEFEVSTGLHRMGALSSAIDRVMAVTRHGEVATIDVGKHVFPGVRIWFATRCATVERPIEGPVQLVFPTSGDPRIAKPDGSDRPLSTCASIFTDTRFPDLHVVRHTLAGLAARKAA